jgi:hypothetical protein
MEVIIEIVVGILIELFFPIFLELLFVLGFDSLASSLKERKETNKYLVLFGCLLLGSIMGCLSLVIYPKHIFNSNPIPGIGLIISPAAAGFAMKKIGDMRMKSGKRVSTLTTFAGGALFAFAYSLWRFLYAG